MDSFIIKEKKLKRTGDLTKQNEKSGIPFAIFLVIVFIIAYLLFYHLYFY